MNYPIILRVFLVIIIIIGGLIFIIPPPPHPPECIVCGNPLTKILGSVQILIGILSFVLITRTFANKGQVR